MTMARGPGLYEFLIEAELQQYYSGIRNELKVQNVSQLKYVTEEDLQNIGMSKPEMRRLKKFFQRHFPQNYLSKFKKMILPKREEPLTNMVGEPEEGLEKPANRHQKHIISPNAILVNKELGAGEFGVVQQGVWTNDRERIQVAIKCLSKERMQNNPIEFLKEAAIMHSIDHEHIVRLYGVVLDFQHSFMLVTELAPLRSLLECLKEPSLRASFPILSLCDFAIQVCDGMQYLEMKRFIHRDLAARNILVFSKNKVKISDFGLSRALGVGKDYYQTNFNVNLKLPIAWCAPECISYLRFTSASDVWAYGVTLWEMFSYGFQPWAALTGHQILEAIDEPNFQRLEQPDCCPKEYYSVMRKCWQHDPSKRPRFADLMNILPECKPEQVQAVQDLGDGKVTREHIVYHVGDVVTVLDKTPLPNVSNVWKGALHNGKTGLFNPGHTVTYLGSNLPASNKPCQFTRGDGKNTFSSRRRLRPEMISSPQGDLKHTGHLGLDGVYFGDLSCLSGKQYNEVPRQIVAPYKPHEDNRIEDAHPSPLLTRTCSDVSDRAPLLMGEPSKGSNFGPQGDANWSDYPASEDSESQNGGGGASANANATANPAVTRPTIQGMGKGNRLLMDHDYDEISDEERANVADSPRFEKSFDFGPSLLDEMECVFQNLGSAPQSLPVVPSSPPPPSPLDEATNERNELREMAAKLSGNRKKQATLKPISASDERSLDTAIALATEIASRSINNFDSDHREHGPDSPKTPASPNKRKFAFRFPPVAVASSSSTNGIASGARHGMASKGAASQEERRNFAEEAASIPDLQSLLSAEAKAVYSSLVENSAAPGSAPTKERQIQNEAPNSGSFASEGDATSLPEGNPLRMLRFGPMVRKGNKHGASLSNQGVERCPSNSSKARNSIPAQSLTSSAAATRRLAVCHPTQRVDEDEPDACLANRTSDTEGDDDQNSAEGNPIPLPPRDRSRPVIAKPRHQRKHPLIFPSGGVPRTIAIATLADAGTSDSELLSSVNCASIRPNGLPIHSDHIDDSFDDRIACELEALDDIRSPEGDVDGDGDLLNGLNGLSVFDATTNATNGSKAGVAGGSGFPGGPGVAGGSEVAGGSATMLRHSDHVSCEDLLEFAQDGPNARRTSGKARGVDSDEVRIMRKVLGSFLPVERCLAALNAANWDVHRAIKLLKLQNLLSSALDLEGCCQTLESCGWDVEVAASWLLSDSYGGETTHV